MPVENRLPVEILEFVQPNRVIDPNNLPATAKIYDFVKDDGTNLGKVVEETVTGNNGILYTIRNFITTTGAAAGTYLTSGLLAMPIELSVASALGMAGLAIGGGAVLNMWFPDLFQEWSDWLFGDTVDGLPVLYWDRYGRLMLDENTLNKTKDFLIEKKAYLEGFQLQNTGVSSVLLAMNNYSTEIMASNYCPQPVIDIYTSPEEILGYMDSFIMKYVPTWEVNYFHQDIISQNSYYQCMKDFITKYSPSDYLIGLYLQEDYYGRYSYDYHLWALPLKLVRAIVNEVELPLYATYTPEEGAQQVNNEEVYIKMMLGDQYNGSMSYTGSWGYQYRQIYQETDIGYSWLTGLTLRPRYNDDILGYLKHISTTQGSYYAWSDYYKVYKQATETVQIGGQNYQKITTTALDPDLVPYRCYPRSTQTLSGLISNRIYEGNVPYYDPDLIIDGKVTTFCYELNPELLSSLYPGGVDRYYYQSSDNHLMIPGFGKLLVEDYIDNRWVTPGATIPVENEDVTVTYPEWPKTVVQGIGNLLHVTPQDLNPTADQSIAQSDGLDIPAIDWIEYFRNILSQVSPNPEPVPDPEPTPEPTPQPDPDPAPSPVTGPDPDPADPNTPITPDPNPVIPPNLNTVTSSRLFTVYWPTANELDLLGATLWSQNFITQMEKVWNDPMQGVISLKKIYALPTSTDSAFIILGNFDTTIMSRIVANQFVYTDCGTLQVPEVMHNATDFTPYTQIAIYLPFIGIQELDADDIVGGRLHLIYRFDLYTGVCLAELYVLRADMNPEKMLYCFTGNAAQEIPLTGSNAQGFFNTLMTIGGGAIVAASGGALTGAVGVAAIGHSMSHEMTHVGRSGNLSANAGIMGNRYPQIIISNRNRYDANGYNTIYGYPANKTVYLGNCTGFTKVKAVNLQTFATQQEKDEIEQLLKQGVIF